MITALPGCTELTPPHDRASVWLASVRMQVLLWDRSWGGVSSVVLACCGREVLLACCGREVLLLLVGSQCIGRVL